MGIFRSEYRPKRIKEIINIQEVTGLAMKNLYIGLL